MIKRKKNAVAVAQQQILTDHPVGPLNWELDLNSLVHFVKNLGFRQVLPPPAEERKFFADERLQDVYGPKIAEIAAGGEHDFVLSPTYVLSVFKDYLQRVRDTGPHVARWFYVSPLQKFHEDRQELKHELGMFIFGDQSVLANAHLINSVSRMLKDIGLPDFVFELNSMGCPGCQKDYLGMLREHLEKVDSRICEECSGRLGSEPMRIWNCLTATCREIATNAPQIVDFLDDNCRKKLIGILEALDELEIIYELNPGLHMKLMSENVVFRVALQQDRGESLGSGGNSTGFFAFLGKEALPASAVGFVTTLEDLAKHIPDEKKRLGNTLEVFVISLGETAARRALLLQKDLQRAGIQVGEAMLENAGIKQQLKQALEHRVSISLIIGQKEAIDGMVILRDMLGGMQETFSNDRIVEEVQKRLGK